LNIIIVGCNAYMETGYGCPGEWRCLTAVAQKDEAFKNYDDPKIVGFLRCECPGRSTLTNLELILKKVKADKVHFSKCLYKANPPCPYFKPEELADAIKAKTGLDVIMGTHDYPL